MNETSPERRKAADGQSTRVFRRQYLIGPEPVEVRPGWVTRRLRASLWISHCPSLPAAWQQDRDERWWGLLGIATQSDPAAPDPLEVIARSGSAAVPQAARTWAGRWVLLDDIRLHPDAVASLSCFVRLVDGRAWLSSSAGLLAELPAPLAAAPDARTLPADGLSWYPLPGSRLPGITALMASQVLVLHDGQVEARPPVDPVDPGRDPDETLQRWSDALATTLRRLPRDQPLWLAVTSGRDSRLLLALARSVDLPVTTYTQDHRDIRLADRCLPPRIAAAVGYSHVLVRRRPVPSLTAGGLRRHTGGQAPPRPERLLLDGLWEFGRGVALRGNSCMIGKGSFPRKRLPDSLADAPRAAKLAALLAAYGEPASSTAAASLAEWLAWCDRTPQENLDWRDRFHLEQRLGGWMSALEQQSDVSPVSSVQVANAASSYALVLSLPQSLRLGGGHHIEIIRRLAPQLLDFPLTPPDRALGTARAVVQGLRTNPRRFAHKALRRARRAGRYGR